MKFVNGKLRTAFQTRSANNNDKYQYQNGIYYAYSDDQNGATDWKNHSGVKFNIPLSNPAPLKIYEPGDLVSATGKNEVYIVAGFDFTVTSNEDVHIISKVQDNKNNITKYLHSYKPNGDANFTHSTDFSGADALYTSGKGVYIIGLNAGRPFVKRTNGGENNFVTVYESSVATSFSHGVPHIYQGKLYYYLQEKGNSTSLPLHVQIIDLDLPPEDIKDVPPEGYTFAAVEGQNLAVTDTIDIAFGAKGAFNFQYNVTQDVKCTSSVFGDPIPGVNKKCYTKPSTDIDKTSSDHSCTVADNGFTPAQARFGDHCPNFTRNRCERIETHNEWVICSSLPDFSKGISIINLSSIATIQAEDYARAIDLSTGNLGGVYRDGDVDIISMLNGESGYSVSQIVTGESLSYDILVTEKGVYELTLNSASPASNSSISIDIDGDQKISSQRLPDTGSYKDYKNTSFIIGELNSGSQVITITVEQGGFNLNSLSIQNVQGQPELPDTEIDPDDKEEPENDSDAPNTDTGQIDKEESESGFNEGGGSINQLLLILMTMTLLINRRRSQAQPS